MPYQEKNGKWRGHKMVDGKRRTKLFKIKKEAKKWEAMFSQEKSEEMKTGMVSLIRLANGYLDHAKNTVGEKTYKEEKIPAFKRLFKKIDPDVSVDKLTPLDCLEFLTIQAKTRSGNAANKDRKNLSAAWSWGIKYMNLSRDNPFKTVALFPSDSCPRYVPPEEDFWTVYAIASDEQKVLLLTFLHTAARRGEVFRLQWDDIDFARGLVRLGTRKRMGGALEYDFIPMTQELKNVLSEKKKNTESVYLFCDEYGQPYKNRQHLLRRLCKRADVKKFGFHAIRHLSASILAHEGTDIPTIQYILRHKDIHTTSRYLHKLGITENVMDSVFSDRAMARVTT